ncbi:TauD/TfdA family dioxygenase [Streptomyces sp. NPDC052396]|uniref:TauD/TfdA family dioxygenase n=1 Tax=Streptomyces sp. NPDC052396 TaxID=3365689 RepID=UPI0037D69E16
MNRRFPLAGRRRTVDARSASWMAPTGDPGLPLEAAATREGVDPAEWARTHPDTVDGWLHRYGAVLFRGACTGLDTFGEAVQALAGTPEAYVERSTPRTELGHRLYSATDHPADQAIALHNENSYQLGFPARLVFGCLTPARTGGATPLADTRRVLARLEPSVVAAFAERGVLYQRNYGDGLGVRWQDAFGTADKAAVAAYCAARGIDVIWKPDGGLRTTQVRPALAVHPVTGERVWFNHAAFFHISGHPPAFREALLAQFAERDLPSNTYYGDGSPIEPSVLEHLRAAYAAERVARPWQTGDVLLVDNLLAAHGREPFTGERRVVVGMARPLTWEEVRA